MDSGWFQAGLMLLAMLLSGGAVYAGIRADLARIHEKVETVSRVADRAHERIDRIMEGVSHG